MQDNVIDRLRAKEEEMEALVAAARSRAAFIRVEALKKAAEARSSGLAALEDEIQRLGAEFEADIKKDIAEIEKDAGREAAALREKGGQKTEAAIRQAAKFIMEGIDWSGDDKGDVESPHNRAEDTA